MDSLKKLNPQIVWSYFNDICNIPRPSKQEDKIIAYLMNFGKEYELETERDEIGNVLIRKPASASYENRVGVVLQSHIDMVCEKNSNVVHDFFNDPIQPFIDGDWVKAKGTTLGADDGIGIAAQLALLASNKIEHPPIECLFTVDEETGLTGAFALKPDFLKHRTLINLDSEDEGELFIGCAGGIDTIATLNFKTKNVPKNSVAYKISVFGLRGGHSGDDIHKGYGNANKILNRFLYDAGNEFKIQLTNFDGGNLRNAIPREASAVFTCKEKYSNNIQEFYNIFSEELKNEYNTTEPKLAFELTSIELPTYVLKPKSQKRLLKAIYACPNGVIAMSQAIDGLVETSTNLASVKFKASNVVEIVTSQRSSVNSAKLDIAHMVESVFKLAKAKVRHSDGYPGWQPNTNSAILKATEDSYQKLFGKKPIVRAIHAGLECGLFLEKYPDMDMISFGPTIKNAHSPDEMIEIKTVEKFWDHLLDVLKNIPIAL